MTTTKTICFSDIKDSCGLTEALGHSHFREVIRDHLDVSRALAGVARGTYVKNIGDANMVKFDGAMDGLLFAALLQEYCMERPCVEGASVAVKVGLHHGEVLEDVLPDDSSPDAFGQGVAMAARVQSAASDGEVLVSERVMDFVRQEWPSAEVAKYFEDAGEHELKGFGQHTLWRFDWAAYLKGHPDAGLAGVTMKQLEEAGVVPLSLSAAAIADPGLVIWPIVPRAVVTAIHRAQAEVVRLLARLGWRVRVLIADCGAHEYDARLVKSFSSSLLRYLEYRGVAQVDIELLSAAFDPTGPDYPEMQGRFQQVTRELPLEKLLAMNNKSYSEEVKDDIRKSPSLEFLRPSLIISALTQMAKREDHKTIVVAGNDEDIQYRSLMDLPNARERLGVLMIPILSEGEPGSPQTRQSVNGPIWESQAELRMALGTGNLAWWAFSLLDFLPVMPRNSVSFARPEAQVVTPADWTNRDQSPPALDLAELAEHLWPYLDPQH